MDQVKFVEISQILLGPFLNTLPYMQVLQVGEKKKKRKETH